MFITHNITRMNPNDLVLLPPATGEHRRIRLGRKLAALVSVISLCSTEILNCLVVLLFLIFFTEVYSMILV